MPAHPGSPDPVAPVEGGGRYDPEPCLRVTRALAIALLASPVAVLAGVLRIGPGGHGEALAPPSILFALVAPALAYRLYGWIRERRAGVEDARGRCASFQRATWVALGVSEGAALLGLAAFLMSGREVSVAGLAAHVLVAGLVWPTRTRLENFLDEASAR